MFRYFDLYKSRLTAKLDIENGSDEETASIDIFKKYFKTDDVREVNRVEYNAITKKYRNED